MPQNFIDTARASANLRTRAIDLVGRRILMTNLMGSEEAKDFTLPANCGGFGRIHHFRREQSPPFPQNSLPIDPAAKFLGLGKPQVLQVQVFQNAVCTWRCWYCFVDFNLLSGNPKFSEFKSVGEILNLYLAESNRPSIIDLSGGQPDLVPEWTLWFLRELLNRGLKDSVYVWGDDNLSNDYLWRYLKPNELEELVAYRGYGRVGCFKGFDSESFSFNTSASPELFDQQFSLMRRLVEAGFDVYGYATFTSPNERHIEKKMADFVDMLQEKVHPNFPLRTIPLRISVFTPTAARVGPDQRTAIEIQQIAVAAWTSELERRFDRTTLERDIMDHTLD